MASSQTASASGVPESIAAEQAPQAAASEAPQEAAEQAPQVAASEAPQVAASEAPQEAAEELIYLSMVPPANAEVLELRRRNKELEEMVKVLERRAAAAESMASRALDGANTEMASLNRSGERVVAASSHGQYEGERVAASSHGQYEETFIQAANLSVAGESMDSTQKRHTQSAPVAADAEQAAGLRAGRDLSELDC